ncbi:MAG: hypothetical protein EOO75_01650 [Myxococcales bacterium]|nr:MAG: hypothetical protein EOO75_01650 [Myxococcales bacterium]
MITRSSLARPSSLAALAALVAGCAWSDFDDLKKDAPVEFIDRPGNIQAGFGRTIAADPRHGALLLGGYPGQIGVSLLDLASPTRPQRTACDSAARCRLLGTPVPVPDRGGGQGCFVFGVGPASEGGDIGLVGGCASGVDFGLPLPGGLPQLLAGSLFTPGGPALFANVLTLAAGATGALAIGSPDVRRVYLTDGAQPPVELAQDEAGFGASLALVDDGQGPRTLAVGSYGSGRVRLYEGSPGAPLAPRGCLERGGTYGVTLHALMNQAQRLLVVSDGAGLVEVIDPAKLPPTTDCGPPPAAAIVDTFHCTDTEAVGGCEGAAFGYSLASTDTDGDGRPEVIVGAPGLNVRGVANAGALLIFTLDPTTDEARRLYLPSAQANDRVGTAVAALQIAGSLALASGAIDQQKTLLFHCVSPGAERCR